MALSSALQLRARLSDRHRRTAQYVYGDGTATAFFLSGFPIPSGAGSATVRLVLAGGVLSATGGTAWHFGDGILAFGTALSANSGALTEYVHSIFSDEEIDTITALQAGDLNAQTLEGLRWLWADYAKRVKWDMAQGPSVDPTEAAKRLEKMIQYYEDLADRHAEGGLESWAEYEQTTGGDQRGTNW